jgi:hypothetical protein
VSNYNRYLEIEDTVLLETTKDLNPQDYKEQSRVLTRLLKTVVIKFPHRNVGGLRKRYLRLHGIVKLKQDHERIRQENRLTPGPKASYIPDPPPVQPATTDPIGDSDWFIKPPSLDRLMSRRG